VLSEGEPFNQDQASESQFLDFSTKAIWWNSKGFWP
jgi:hypothetical protein